MLEKIIKCFGEKKYLYSEHPEFANQLPDNALIVMQIDGDEAFNQWARETVPLVAEKDTSVVYVTITELKPVRSRIERLRVELVA
jgi:hypothetical protein